MGNQGEFICPNCQGKLFRMIPKINMTKEELDSETAEAQKGKDAHRFKIIDEKLYRDEWESGMMIWTCIKKDLIWDLTKEATWICRCGHHSQNYKDFIERNGKVRKEGDEFDMTDIIADFYIKNGYVAPVKEIKKEQE